MFCLEKHSTITAFTCKTAAHKTWFSCAGIGLQHEADLSAFGAYLQAGGTRGGAVHPTPSSRVVQQVLFIGQMLIDLHQEAHIDQLLALSGNAADTLGAAFLKVS